MARLVADGLKDGAIARQLGIATSSVAGYVARVKRRLGLSRRDGIAAWVRARRVADDPETPLQRVEDRHADAGRSAGPEAGVRSAPARHP